MGPAASSGKGESDFASPSYGGVHAQSARACNRRTAPRCPAAQHRDGLLRGGAQARVWHLPGALIAQTMLTVLTEKPHSSPRAAPQAELRGCPSRDAYLVGDCPFESQAAQFRPGRADVLQEPPQSWEPAT